MLLYCEHFQVVERIEEAARADREGLPAKRSIRMLGFMPAPTPATMLLAVTPFVLRPREKDTSRGVMTTSRKPPPSENPPEPRRIGPTELARFLGSQRCDRRHEMMAPRYGSGCPMGFLFLPENDPARPAAPSVR